MKYWCWGYGARRYASCLDRGYPKLEEIDKFADGIVVQKVGVKTYEVAPKICYP